MVNRYQNFGPVLQELGYDVTPVEGKRPIVSRWSERPEEATQWEKYATSGVGVVLGGKHNLVAVDIDVLTKTLSRYSAKVSNLLQVGFTLTQVALTNGRMTA